MSNPYIQNLPNDRMIGNLTATQYENDYINGTSSDPMVVVDDA